MASKFSLVTCAMMLALVSLPACQTNNQPARNAGNGMLVGEETALQLGGRIQWYQDLHLGKGGYLHIQSDPDKMIVVEKGNLCTVIDANSGQIDWRHAVGDSVDKLFRPSRVDKVLVINSEARTFIFNMASGNKVNELINAHPAAAGPLVVNDHAVYGSLSGMIFAMRLNDGYVSWQYQMTGALLTEPVMVGEDIVVAADGNGVVKAFDAGRKGDLFWGKTGPPWKRISAQPVANDSAVYIACEDQTLYGFDKITGDFWRYLAPAPLTESPTVLGDHVFINIPSQGLTCFDAFTGEVIWVSELTGKPLSVRKNQIILVRDQEVVFIEAATGNLVRSIALPQVDRVTTDAPVNGNLYLFNNDGRMMKIAIR